MNENMMDLDRHADSLSAAIGITLGFASTCWDENGVFQVDMALKAGEELEEWVRTSWGDR